MVGVIDGDTIDVLHDAVAERIRLNGIDCPEKRPAFGRKAKEFTSEMVFGKEVRIITHKRDRYGRTIGDVIVSDTYSLNHELLRAGLAWWYRQYAPDNRSLEQLENEAREEQRGLWAEPNPIPPWTFRHSGQRQ